MKCSTSWLWWLHGGMHLLILSKLHLKWSILSYINILKIFFNRGSGSRDTEDGPLKCFRDEKVSSLALWPFHHLISSLPCPPPPQGMRELLNIWPLRLRIPACHVIYKSRKINGLINANRTQRDLIAFLKREEEGICLSQFFVTLRRPQYLMRAQRLTKATRFQTGAIESPGGG